MSPKAYYERPEDWANRLSELFTNDGVRVAIIGGLAAVQYRAEPRHTVDADFVIDRLAEVDVALRREGFTIEVLNERDGSPYMVRGTSPDGMHLDVYVAQTEFEHAVLQRRTPAGYASPEDVIVYKLLAWRPHDREDIAQILRAQPTIDRAYIAGWAGRWEVTEHWDEALLQHRLTQARRPAQAPRLPRF